METKAVIKILEMALMDIQADISIIRMEGIYKYDGVGRVCKKRILTKKASGLWSCEFSSARKFEDCTYYSVSCFCTLPREIDDIIESIIDYDADGSCEILEYKITME